jgi:Family of unknown function (DUF6311)
MNQVSITGTAPVRSITPALGNVVSRQSGGGLANIERWRRNAGRMADFLLCPRPVGLLLCGSLVCALCFCLHLFQLRFLSGNSAYWQSPEGLIRNGWGDITTALSGYDYFVRDAWTLPLFQTSKLGVPHPVNIIFTDSIPIVAICGRLLYRVTGHVVNLYGAWTGLCFIGSALSMTGLVATLRQRGLAPALAATVCGLCMPALLARWGHMSLMAQWEIPLAYIIYFQARSALRAFGLAAAALLLAMVTLWTHPYLFAMVIGILGATLAQAVVDRRLPMLQAVPIAGLFAIVLAGLMFVSGYFSNQAALDAEGFGTFSMNVLSPIFPQDSALLPILGNTLMDATGGQYEGFSYLGAGVLMLVVITVPWWRQATVHAWPDHCCMLALLVGFALFAVSNQVYVAAWHVFAIPLPAPILTLAGIFRSSGRFIWPCLYLAAAGSIIAVPALWGRAGSWLLVIAAVAQLLDTTPLQSALAARTATPTATSLAAALWLNAIGRHDFVRVVPAFGCPFDRGTDATTGKAAIDLKRVVLDLQLWSARRNVATNSVYAARHTDDCQAPLPAAVSPRELRIYRDPRAGNPFDTDAECASSAVLAVCSRQLGASDLSALVAAGH